MSKRVIGIEDKSGFSRDESLPGDCGNDAIRRALVAAFKHTAKNAFLPPDFTGGEFFIRCEAGEFRTCAGATGGAVVFAAGAQYEITAMIRGIVRRSEKLDVIDFGIACGAHGVAQ